MEIVGKTPKEIKQLGILSAFVPEDRLGMGLVASMDMTDNVMLRYYDKGRRLFVDRKGSKKLAQSLIEQLGIVTPGVATPVRRLSGGNVQKVLLGREIASQPQVLIVAYPVRGLDINSSYMIYDLLNEQKKRNVAILFVGEDLDVLLELSDRILVLCGGEASGIVDAEAATKEQVGLLMTQVPDHPVMAGEVSGTGAAILYTNQRRKCPLCASREGIASRATRPGSSAWAGSSPRSSVAGF
jgi:simple sugar transport system ATP-binding protein